MTYKEVFNLAQFKGFDNLFFTHTYKDKKIEKAELKDLPPAVLDMVYADLCFIQKWLRDTHKIFVEIVLQLRDRYSYALFNTQNGSERKAHAKNYAEHYVTYEETLLHGIKEALTLIDNN